MQTFVIATEKTPVLTAIATANGLDRARLGKQRVECKQIWTALETGKGWIHHPATHMWRGHQDTLALYGFLMCLEFQKRGYQDNLRTWFYERANPGTEWPWWFGNKEMVATHRSKLIGKMPEKYKEQFAFDYTASTFILPYIWPDPEIEGQFFLSAAEQARTDWVTPAHWRVENGIVTFGDEKRWKRAQDDGVFYDE